MKFPKKIISLLLASIILMLNYSFVYSVGVGPKIKVGIYPNQPLLHYDENNGASGLFC